MSEKQTTNVSDDERAETMGWLVRNACLSADPVAMHYMGSESGRTQAIIARALNALEGNGLIRFVPREEWPEFYVAEPPYSISKLWS